MLYSKVVLNIVIIFSWFLVKKSIGDSAIPFNENLITSLRNDANLDLPMDEEYEDLRAELLAYHTALATLSDTATRRSMKTTPCWNLGGICVNHKLCEGHKYISEVPGCKGKLNVCCFAWNKFYVRDWSDYGLYNIAFPWSHPRELGGKGVLEVEPESKKVKVTTKKKASILYPVEKNFIENVIKGKKKKKPEVSSETKETQETEEADNYRLAFPSKEPDEFGEKKVVEIEPKILQLGKKQLMAKEMSDNEFQKKSILRSLRTRLPFLMLSLETE